MNRKMLVSLLLIMMIGMAVFSFAGAVSAADDITNKFGSMNNIKKVSNGDASTEVTATLDKWITNIRVVGIVIALLGIVLGAIVFSVSLGNSQRRALGISSMISAAIGIVILIKAPALASYVINQ